MRAAMVLSAGLGTRLRPLTDELPKALVPVGDRSMLAHVLERLRLGGVARAVVNIHHLPEAFTPAVLAALPLPTSILREPELLGTAGGVASAAEALGDGDVVIWNGDNLADVDVAALVAARSAPFLAVMAYAPRPRGEGTIGVGAGGDLARLRGERFGDEDRGGDFVGVQVIGPELRARLPRVGCLVADGYLPALRSGARIATVPIAGPWHDVGTVGAYLAANAAWLSARGLAHHVGAGAVVSPAVTLSDSIVGAGAVVSGEGILRGCVVWPGAAASAPLERAVITGRATAR